MTYSLGCISSIGEQKAQDKLDNLAAKPFLSQDYQLELAPLASLSRNVAQPSSHFLQTIPTSRALPWPPPVFLPRPSRFSLLFRSLARSHSRTRLRSSLSGTPEVWSDRQRGPRG